MTELPKQVFAAPDSFDDWTSGEWSVEGGDTLLNGDVQELFLRADTAIPRAEADAMVAAAYEAARNAAICAKSDYAAPTARIDIANAIDKLAKAEARAAFEQAVQEAVEAERERCAAMVDAKGQQWWERASGDDFTATDMADLAAAIRAPQETSE